MAKPKEPEPSRGTKIRAGLPGEKWREHISTGAQRAYDYPLANQREEAKKLRHKGRLIAAHRTEKASYKIRARGYDRRKRGLAPVEKALTREVRHLGPYTQKRVRLSLKPATKWENTNDSIRAVGQAIGPFRTVAALGGGAGIAATVHEKSKQAKQIVTGKKPDTENKVVGKAFNIDDINGPYDRLPVVYRRMDIDTINKGMTDEEYDEYLEEIVKLFAPLKAAFRQAAPTAWHAPAEQAWRGARNAWNSGGVGGLSTHLGQQAKPYAEKFGQMSTGQKAAVGAGAGLAGAGAAGYGLYRAAKPMIKRKAKKAAIYGAAGIGGTAALGGYLGSRGGGG